MKTLFASALLALTLSAVSTAFAQDTTPFRAVVKPRADDMKVDVVVEKSTDHYLTVSFLDANGHTLAAQTMQKSETVIRTRFDVATLPDGQYKVVITDGTHIESRAVTLQTPITTRTVAAL